MKKHVKLSKKIIILIIVSILLVIGIIFSINNFKNLPNTMRKSVLAEGGETSSISYRAYCTYRKDDKKYLGVLITISNDNGLEYVEYDDIIIRANGRKSISFDYEVECNTEYGFKTKAKSKEVENLSVNCGDLPDSLLGSVAFCDTPGIQSLTFYNSTKSTSYSSDVIIYNGDMVFDGTNNYEGINLSDNTYSVGDATSDCGTSAKYASNTVVLKVNGNITINDGITLTSVANGSGYGGPKGMVIYCTGNIQNNGTITMTARGAKAAGEYVYLYRNSDNTYEYVPKAGGARNSNGSGRKTGGGGDGAFQDMPDGESYSRKGYGAAGTSYSGGTGGGSGGWHIFYSWQDGATNGGAGGREHGPTPGGGAGNPGGSVSGKNGTGGLLVMYADNIFNDGVISSDGSNGATYGGASGGGSINIFYVDSMTDGTITANGGSSAGATKGGKGTFNLTKAITKF